MLEVGGLDQLIWKIVWKHGKALFQWKLYEVVSFLQAELLEKLVKEELEPVLRKLEEQIKSSGGPYVFGKVIPSF